MSEMAARVRNRLQDGVISWQERRYQNEDFRQQHADIHRSRMTCSDSLPSFHQTQDWTGGLTPSGRVPVIEETKPRQRILSSDGIRWDAAVTVLIAIGVLLAVILLADVAGIGNGGRNLRKLNTSIEELTGRNEQLQAELMASTSNTSICTEAVKMNLISANGATTVRLTVPGNAQLTVSTAAQAAENADIQGRITAFAGD